VPPPPSSADGRHSALHVAVKLVQRAALSLMPITVRRSPRRRCDAKPIAASCTVAILSLMLEDSVEQDREIERHVGRREERHVLLDAVFEHREIVLREDR
jgi:hypothetical protein